MTITTHNARLTASLPYEKPDGKPGRIPVGPCLIEQNDERLLTIIWGTQGQSSAALPLQEVTAAADTGTLVLLD